MSLSLAPLPPDEERAHARRIVLIGLVLPFALALVHVAGLGNPLYWLVCFLIGLLSVVMVCLYVLVRPFYRWSQNEVPLARGFAGDLRLGLPFAPVGTDARALGVPWITYGITLLNIAAFFLVADLDSHMFLPNAPQAWVHTNLTSMFLHDGEEHLLGNMIFLWLFGRPLELRVGRGRYLLTYLVGGTVANALSAVTNFAMGGGDIPSLGSSGAISAILGMYLVRCSSTRISLGIPLFGPVGEFLPVMARVQIPALLLLSFFFLKSLQGGVKTLVGVSDGVDYWAHVGGYLYGVGIAFAAGLFRDGARENARELARRPDSRFAAGGNLPAVRAHLARNPDDLEVLLARARREVSHLSGDAGREDYIRVIRIQSRADRHRAAETFSEAFRARPFALPLREQIALTPALAESGRSRMAVTALDLAMARPGESPADRARGRLAQVRLLETVGDIEAAENVCARLLAEHPGGGVERAARRRLESLRRQLEGRSRPAPVRGRP